MRALVCRAAIALVLCSAGSWAFAQGPGAHAHLERASLPTQAVSMHLPNLLSAGLAVQYERLTWRSLSISALAGARAAAAGDYQSTALGAGVEVRYWVTGRSYGTRRLLARSLVGPYLGARVDLVRTSLHEPMAGADDRLVGVTLSAIESAVVGYRLVMWRGLALTPSAGLAARTDIDRSGLLPMATRGVVTMGLTLDWVY